MSCISCSYIGTLVYPEGFVSLNCQPWIGILGDDLWELNIETGEPLNLLLANVPEHMNIHEHFTYDRDYHRILTHDAKFRVIDLNTGKSRHIRDKHPGYAPGFWKDSFVFPDSRRGITGCDYHAISLEGEYVASVITNITNGNWTPLYHQNLGFFHYVNTGNDDEENPIPMVSVPEEGFSNDWLYHTMNRDKYDCHYYDDTNAIISVDKTKLYMIQRNDLD